MGQRHEQPFLHRRHTNGQQIHEKNLNITNHQGNKIKTALRFHLTPVRWLKLTTQDTIDVGKDSEKGESLYTVGGMQPHAAILAKSMEVPQKVKDRATL